MTDRRSPWWQDAVIYQIYIRSFADSNGDGIGDLEGVRTRLGYLKKLGIDAVWFTPWYKSPIADGGYDVEDYREIHEDFGTLEQAEALIREAGELGIRTIVDIVPNHVSERHPWFRAALASRPGSPERARFWFRSGRGPRGDERPNSWDSIFQGEAWSRTTDEDGRPGEWYLHLFATEQPDLNWNHPDVRAEHEAIIRFWFDRGAAGIRVDSAALLVKAPDLPDIPVHIAAGEHPYEDRDDVHDIYRSWRKVADTYPGDRALIGEVWVPDPSRLPLYVRPGEFHSAFNFDFMSQPWDAEAMSTSIQSTLDAFDAVGAPSTWVLSNHDVTRPVTRYGREDTGFAFARKRFGISTDLELGRSRARAAALIVGALPGSLYIYQGDELGLPEAEDLPPSVLQDPMYFRSAGVDPGRDGCRVPLPWSGSHPPFGFGPKGSSPWLPQPTEWASLTVDAQEPDPASTLNLYRRMIRVRGETSLRGKPLKWDQSFGAGVVAFTRGAEFLCVANMAGAAVPLPESHRVILASSDVVGTSLPGNTAAWLIA